MRIISGKFKNKKLIPPKDKLTRPLRDLVKESIFNVIEHSNKININIENSYILDLFSGSGSFGLEAISRGAKKCIFVEDYIAAFKVLSTNIKNLKCESYCKNNNLDCFDFIENLQLGELELDLIFLDPPYKEENLKIILESIAKFKLLKESGLIVLHRHKKTKDDIGNKFTIQRSVKYGISRIIFLKN